MKNPSIFGSSQKRGVLIPICSRFESETFRESEAILTPPEVCQQSEGSGNAALFAFARAFPDACWECLNSFSGSFHARHS
ncbi:hypothetical protein GHC20_08435 [Brucella sp. 2280]|nr:hypothetical protein GHC20_08435 [Brucella sp. 2280]